MKQFKILSSLHSIKLILISALELIFLAMTDTNKFDKTEARQGNVSIAQAESNSSSVLVAERKISKGN